MRRRVGSENRKNINNISRHMSLRSDSNTYQSNSEFYVYDKYQMHSKFPMSMKLFPSVKATWPDQTSDTYTQMQVSRETGGTGSQPWFLQLCTVTLELLPQWDHSLGLHIVWWDSLHDWCHEQMHRIFQEDELKKQGDSCKGEAWRQGRLLWNVEESQKFLPEG